MLIDLQLHSTYSDGYLNPSQVAEFAAKQGVKVAALTDHNTVGGLDEFRNACRPLGIKPIAGLELYVKLHHWRFNVLWYNFDENSPYLHNILRNSQMRRRRQMRLVLEKLKDQGFRLDINKILDKYNHYVPINHVIDDIIKTSFNLKKIKRETGIKQPREGDIIREYFRNPNIGKLRASYIDWDRIVALKKREVGGQLVLCHPTKATGFGREFMATITGLDGLEKLSPHHSYNSVMFIQHLAREYKLIETGGSDFHRFEGGGHPLQYSWQYYKVDSTMLKGVKKII